MNQPELETVIPVIREEMVVGKDVRKTGTVRVRKTVHEIEDIVRAQLMSEQAQITRRPMDELVDSAPPVRMEGNDVVIPVVEEFVVVTKQLRVVEEIRISKSQLMSNFEQPVTLLGEEVIVERQAADEGARVRTASEY